MNTNFSVICYLITVSVNISGIKVQNNIDYEKYVNYNVKSKVNHILLVVKSDKERDCQTVVKS